MSYFTSLVPQMTYEMFKDILNQQEDLIDQDTENELRRLYDNTLGPYMSPHMNDSDYKYRLEAWTPLDLTKVIVDKIAGGLYGRTVYRTTGIPELDKVLESTWKDMRRFTLRISKLASLVGYTVVRTNLVYPNKIVYSDSGSGRAIGIFDPDNPHGKPVGIIFDYYSNSVEEQMLRALGIKSQGPKHVQEIITRHIRDPFGKIRTPGIHVLFVEGKRVELEDQGYNPMGDYLGCVYWKSGDSPTTNTGQSDVLGLMETMKSLNELITTTHEKIIWSIHSPIVTNLKGDKGFRYGPREMWFAPNDGYIKRLEADHDISSAMELIQYLTSMVHTTSRVPSVAIGDLEHIGNLSSGRAFEIAMTPLFDLIREKELVALEQEYELLEESIALLVYYGALPGSSDLVRRSEEGPWFEPDMEKIHDLLSSSSIEFSAIEVPRDDQSTAQYHVQLLDAELESRETAMAELHSNWTEVQIQEEIKKIEDDKSAEPETVQILPESESIEQDTQDTEPLDDQQGSV